MEKNWGDTPSATLIRLPFKLKIKQKINRIFKVILIEKY